MKKFWRIWLLVVLVSLLTLTLTAQVLPKVPRGDLLIVDALHGRLAKTDFNIWKPATQAGNGIQQALMDTLWYVDPTSGEWINALAAEPPIYNEDATVMTVKLRKGIYWSDGVEFTADDVVFTVKTQIEHPGFNYSGTFSAYVKDVYAKDKYTVVFELKKPYPRFHNFFNVLIYGACYIMPKHVFEKVEDPLKFDFNPPVSLGPYVLKDYDKAGYWWFFERREDWQRTSVGMVYGKPKPKYLLFIYYGPEEKKVLAQAQHQLDCIFDLTPEAWDVLRKRNKYSMVWYKDFPWAWMDDVAARGLCFNLTKFPYNIRQVRWALALSIDIKDVIISGFNGIERLAPLHEAPTTAFMKYFDKPLKEWLEDFTIQVGDEQFKPFDPTIPDQIAEWAKKQGYNVTMNPEDIWGIGWWKYAPDVAEKLLKEAGFTKKDGKWYLPNGEPWKITLVGLPAEIDSARLAFAVADQWRKFGIDTNVETVEAGVFWTRWSLGDFDVGSYWPASASGVSDIWPLYQGWHKRYVVPTGQAASNNQIRWTSNIASDILDKMATLKPGDPRLMELSRDLFKVFVEEMPYICTVINKKFNAYDQYVWTNFPSAENPYMSTAWWWGTFKFLLPFLEPTGRAPSEEYKK